MSEPLQEDNIESFLSTNYPTFEKLLIAQSEPVVKLIQNDGGPGCTIFAPNEDAFSTLGEKKLQQLRDVRNSETTEKIACSHAIAEPVSSDQLFASGGVITLGGEVPVGRSMQGGLFGLGAKEDGGVTVNGAKVVTSFVMNGGRVIVHEVDGLISSKMLWRYMDQLRIPGSK
eukprot:CAMPEP_0113936088 /NCGR_PEP_ID=MMETSP1339-20121228/3069_1 /TAXON_ID=94617 /ORGANISM="Fibrocapsa japonica" /LENGTH=171 /DNA_ID=CAMNT_0000938427 /DNA_START=181 /DNA_END=699 /DNA_ORIENTATION=- /assembly_acc=CAM_ASM_000762